MRHVAHHRSATSGTSDRDHGADLDGCVGRHAVALAPVQLPAADAVDRTRTLAPRAEHTGGMHLVVALWQLIRTGGRRHLVVGEGASIMLARDLRQLGVRRTAHEEHRRLQRVVLARPYAHVAPSNLGPTDRSLVMKCPVCDVQLSISSLRAWRSTSAPSAAACGSTVVSSTRSSNGPRPSLTPVGGRESGSYDERRDHDDRRAPL